MGCVVIAGIDAQEPKKIEQNGMIDLGGFWLIFKESETEVAIN